MRKCEVFLFLVSLGQCLPGHDGRLRRYNALAGADHGPILVPDSLFRSKPAMNFSLLVQLCGYPLLILLVILSLSLSLIAFFLVFGAKQEGLLAAFLPLTILPAAAGLMLTFLDMISSIGLQLNENDGATIEPGFLLQMNLIPIVTGFVAAVPPVCIAVVGRWVLAWKASGITLLETTQHDSDRLPEDHDKWVAQEADDYLEKLVRPR